ncbi:hypothetical protein L7F22_064499 [Adiantum nelumboides]|nr:hypothetical protein [Adiantum nelumboides]
MTIKAVAILSDSEGMGGTVYFSKDADGSMSVFGKLSGLKSRKHGFHVHAHGDTTNGCMSTCGHFNPKGTEHGP